MFIMFYKTNKQKKIILLNSVHNKMYSDHCSLANVKPQDVENLIVLASNDLKNHYSLYFC